MNSRKRFLVVLLTMAIFAWMGLIASQRNVPLMFLAFLGLVWSILLAVRRRLSNAWGLGIVGLLVGYLGMVFSAAIGELAMRGGDFFERSFTNNLFFFPTLSFGWLYGALVFWLASDHVVSAGIKQADESDDESVLKKR